MNKDTTNPKQNLNWLLDQPFDVKAEILTHHLHLSEILIKALLDNEVSSYCGERYSRNRPHGGIYQRYGTNPGSIRMGDKKIPIEVPRVFNKQSCCFEQLQLYNQLKQIEQPSQELIQGVLHGLSMRDYPQVVNYLNEGFGISKSSVSRQFIEATAETLKEFCERRLDDLDIVAIFIDGKYLAKQQMIIALGITMQGNKVALGFVQSTTENSRVIVQFLQSLIDRGLRYEQGLLFIIDGSKGIKKGIEEVFAQRAIIQRCTWHKRENILNYLPQSLHASFKKKYHAALRQSSYEQARQSLYELAAELKKENLSAANSLLEGLEEVLSLHKLKINEDFFDSFSTTNCIENINSQLSKYVGRVKRWMNSEQRFRWIAAALLEVEMRTRKVNNFRNLSKMRNAIIEYLQIQTTQTS